MADNKKFTPTVYSQAGYANPEGEIEQSRLGISYWNNYMKIDIGIKKDGANGKYTYETAASIYLTYVKALMLAHSIDVVMEGAAKSSGVLAGSGYIGVCKTDEGKYLLTVLNISQEGEITNTTVYEVKSSHYNLINDISLNSDNTYTHTDQFLPNLELEILQMTLRSFANAMTYAEAYASTVTSQRDARLNKLFGIAGKLGVNDNGGGGGFSSSRTDASDVFAKSSSDAPIQQGSIDDIF